MVHDGLCPCRSRVTREHMEGVEVPGLGQTAGLHKFQIIPRVIGHHGNGRRVETLQQEGAFVVEREVDRPPECVHAAGLSIGGDGVQEGRRNRPVVHTLVHAEEGDFFVLELIMVAVKDAGNASHRFSAAIGQEQIPLGVFEERVLADVEFFLDVHQQGGYPVRVALVDFPGEMNEPAELRFGPDLLNTDVTHG